MNNSPGVIEAGEALCLQLRPVIRQLTGQAYSSTLSALNAFEAAIGSRKGIVDADELDRVLRSCSSMSRASPFWNDDMREGCRATIEGICTSLGVDNQGVAA